MTKHLPIGGSTAARTINCPGWLEQVKKYNPAKRSNVAADVGNLLHDAIENYYLKDIDFADQVGKTTFKDLTLTTDHLPSLTTASNMVETIFDKYAVEEYLCEPLVQYEEDKIGGSIDILGVGTKNGNKYGIILDYKFGANRVNAENCSQLLFYAMCAIKDGATKDLFHGVTNFAMVIVQPKCSRTADTWECTIDDIMIFERKLMMSLESTELKAGKHCQYCPAAPYCEEKKKQALKALTLSKTSATALGQAWTLAKELEPWIKEVKAEIQDKLMGGADIPELKLVAGRKKKVWRPEAEAELKENYPDKAYEVKLISPAKAVKEFGKDKVEHLYIETTEAPVIKHISEKGDAIVIDPNQKFEEFVNSKQ